MPAYHSEQQKYALAVMGENEKMTQGYMNIPEPLNPQWIGGEDVDFMIVPGLAFDRQGGRVGYGGGCYDRMLKNTSASKVGLAFGFQLIDHVPLEEHDICLDMVVTETEVITVS